MLHLYIDYLAFRDEVRFYSGKTSMAGVSISSIWTNLVCSIILFLYLMDGGGMSTMILITIGGEICVQGWKVWRMMVQQDQQHPFSEEEISEKKEEEEKVKKEEKEVKVENNYEYQIDAKSENATATTTIPSKRIKNTYILDIERKMKEYDRIAVLYLALLLYPIIAGMGLY